MIATFEQPKSALILAGDSLHLGDCSDGKFNKQMKKGILYKWKGGKLAVAEGKKQRVRTY